METSNNSLLPSRWTLSLVVITFEGWHYNYCKPPCDGEFKTNYILDRVFLVRVRVPFIRKPRRSSERQVSTMIPLLKLSLNKTFSNPSWNSSPSSSNSNDRTDIVCNTKKSVSRNEATQCFVYVTTNTLFSVRYSIQIILILHTPFSKII